MDTQIRSKAEEFLADAIEEFDRATSMHGPMHSLHEAYAALAEEVDELWDGVRKKSHERDPADVRKELVQIAVGELLRRALHVTCADVIILRDKELFYKNGVKLGEVLAKDDGLYDFWPDLSKGGCWPSHLLREIADLLDDMNRDWERELTKALEEV